MRRPQATGGNRLQPGARPEEKALVPTTRPPHTRSSNVGGTAVGLRGLESVLKMKIYLGAQSAGLEKIGFLTQQAVGKDGKVVEALRAEVRALESKLRDKGNKPGKQPLIRNSEESDELKAVIQRLKRAEARLQCRDREAMLQSTQNGTPIRVSGVSDDGNLVKISLTLSRFSIGAAAAMFAGVFTAGTLGNAI